ncbi:uncharacterized protein LOC116201133 isoform X2 [Punica granatum]|uniref:Uncharacterized protein LOC116201133 isoform X2 n=2 Tax=Punica granatum TaxID=22663 RepID=A0A6P8CVS4_PUNGR|nr:uncharacterized protein LOC116201133 isoform X2 [Punica granatum]
MNVSVNLRLCSEPKKRGSFLSFSMASPSLQSLYRDSCKKHHVLPNAALLSWFSKADEEKTRYRKYNIAILLDQLMNGDLFPLIDVFQSIGTFEFERVDILHESSCHLNAELLLSLLRAANEKLDVVDLQDMSFGEDFFSDLSQNGISCRVLNLWSVHLQKLNMVGKFTQLHTLNLDFCASITNFHKDCFSGMPNLMRLSLCETRVSNLWAATTALSNLPSLVELRFQKCLCCWDTGPCHSLYGEKLKLLDSDDSDVKLCDQLGRMGFSRQAELEKKIQDGGQPLVKQHPRAMDQSLKKYISHHPSPICYEKHYREYMIVSLPCLKVLDNLLILKKEKEMARHVFSSCYEYLPYKRKHRESVADILHKREMGTGNLYHPRSIKRKDPGFRSASPSFYSRALSAAKFGSSTWPLVEPVSKFSHLIKDETRQLRPRQFEYHPSEPDLMVFGTLDGEIVVINSENRKIVSFLPSAGTDNSILGLSWLKKYPSMLIAGSDNGSLKLFDIDSKQPNISDQFHNNYVKATFNDFEQLTSVHVNSTDEQFLASGYSRDLALYDIGTGKRIELFTDLHREPINVAKFAYHSPFMFATSSFDRDVKMWDLRQKMVRPCYTASSSRGNIMACFSPDDLYLLVSAVDNEVKQLLAVDGRPHTNFEIAPTGSSHNYTRSYYMNGRDYIISGSCDEQVVRVCCAQTGRRLRDVYVEDGESGNSLYIQSLRGDPFRDFHLSVLAASTRLSSKLEIMKINLLTSDQDAKEHAHAPSVRPSFSLGG